MMTREFFVWGAHAPRVLARRLAERTFLLIILSKRKDRFGGAPKPAREARALPRPMPHAFTLLELLIVISIIIILAGLILATSGYVQKKGARSRAEAEIAALSAACESYRADNGIYPRGNADSSPVTTSADTDVVDPMKMGDPSSSNYTKAATALYNLLSGAIAGSRTATRKPYFSFKPNMLMPSPPSVATVTAIRDPFGNSYGYSTTKANGGADGYNPTFDLWSTAGTISGTPTDQQQWIKNW